MADRARPSTKDLKPQAVSASNIKPAGVNTVEYGKYSSGGFDFSIGQVLPKPSTKEV